MARRLPVLRAHVGHTSAQRRLPATPHPHLLSADQLLALLLQLRQLPGGRAGGLAGLMSACARGAARQARRRMRGPHSAGVLRARAHAGAVQHTQRTSGLGAGPAAPTALGASCA